MRPRALVPAACLFLFSNDLRPKLNFRLGISLTCNEPVADQDSVRLGVGYDLTRLRVCAGRLMNDDAAEQKAERSHAKAKCGHCFWNVGFHGGSPYFTSIGAKSVELTWATFHLVA